MNQFDNFISELYNSLKKKDFFNEEISEDNFDWDSYFFEAHELNLVSTLIEKFELKSSNVYSGGLKEVYDLETLSGKKFLLHLDYYNKNKIDYFAFSSIQIATEKDSPSSVEFFKKLKDSVKDDEYMCFIRFEDEAGRHSLTNDVGLNSFEVFSSLRRAVLQSFVENKFYTGGKLKGFVFLIAKNEKNRRLKLYKKLVTKTLPEYSNVFVDDISDKDFTHLIITK